MVTDCFLHITWMSGSANISEYILMLGQLAPAPLRNPHIKLTCPLSVDKARA